MKHGILTPDFLERNIFWHTGELIINKIIKTVATSCQILRLKCTKFDFSWGSAPDPTGGAYSAPQTPKLVLRGPPRNVAILILTPSQKIVPTCLIVVICHHCCHPYHCHNKSVTALVSNFMSNFTHHFKELQSIAERGTRVFCTTQHIRGHFGDESFQGNHLYRY